MTTVWPYQFMTSVQFATIYTRCLQTTPQMSFLCFVDSESRYICVMKTNLMNYLSPVYSFNQPLHVSGIFVVHHQEVYCIYVQSCQQKSIGLKFSKSQTGSDMRYSCHHNSSRFNFPIFAHSCRFSVLHSLQSITLHIQGVTGGTDQTSGGCSLC